VLIAFVVGFGAVLAALEWLILRVVTPETPWWEILHMCINSILIAIVFGGLGFAALSSVAMHCFDHRD
jgi:hypothetical protein